MAVRDWAAVYLKGAAMGAADAVPGVSGGTIALITGIYERLVGAIAALDPEEALALLPLVPRLGSRDAREEFWSALAEMEVPFLLVLGVGLISAVVTVANAVDVAYHQYPGLTFAFFFGLIAASVVVLVGEVSVDTPGRIAAGVAGFALAFVLSGQAQADVLPSGLAVLFVVGAVAICAMVLPGVSGSLILLTVGKYETMTGAVSDATDALLAGDVGGAVEPVTTLVVFALGAFVGVLSFARAVQWALDAYRAATLTFLVALMAGALRAPAVRIADATSAWTVGSVAPLAVAGAIGAGAVLVLDATTDDLDY
jgi:putative membrane protein